MHLRGSGHEVFCRNIAALLSRSRALSHTYIVQRFLSDLGPHDNIVQRLYQLSIRGSILLDLGSVKGELFISFQLRNTHTIFHVQFKGLIILCNVLGVHP